jgi:signal transduction histidine kinase
VAGTPRRLVVQVPTQPLAPADWVTWALLPWLLGVAHILVGAGAYALNPLSRPARCHWWFCLAFGLFLTGYFSIETCGVPAFHVANLAQTLIMPTGIQLAATLPRRWPWISSQRRFAVGGWLAALVVIGVIVACQVGLGELWADMAVLGLTAVGVLSLLISSAWAMLSRSSTPLQRRQGGIILVGPALGFLPGLTAVVAAHAGLLPEVGLAWIFLGGVLFPLSIAYAILRHQLFDIQVIMRRATLYALLLAGLGAVYEVTLLAVVYVGTTALGTALLGGLAAPPPSAGMAGAFAVALAYRPLQRVLRRRVDRLFLGERADVLQLMGEFGRLGPDGPAEIAASLLTLLNRALQPAWALMGSAQAVTATWGTPPAAVSGLVQSPRHGALPDLLAEAEALALYVPLHGPAGGTDFLLLGPRRNGQPYTAEERGLLRAMAARVAVALAHARIRQTHAEMLVQEGIARSLAEERRQILRQVLHDLRNDLMNIALTVEIARRRPHRDEPLAAIRESMARIERFLDEKTPGPGPAVATRAGVAAAMQATARLLGEALRQKQQTLSLTLPACDLVVALTPLELEQILTNLVGNAGKFAPPQTTIRLTTRLAGDQAVITVSDEGPGIPEALIDHLGSGQRADHTIPGSGFGMQNVRDLAAKAGGHVSWRNGDGGAVVTVALPVVTAPARVDA